MQMETVMKRSGPPKNTFERAVHGSAACARRPSGGPGGWPAGVRALTSPAWPAAL